MPGHPQRRPPAGILSDLRRFFLHRPRTQTLIELASEAERSEFGLRAFQRVGVEFDRYAVLNIHRIGIDAPVQYVYEQTRLWDGAASCWPDHIATVYRADGDRPQIRIRLLGHLFERVPLLGRLSRAGTIFELQALDIRTVPYPGDLDNARYLLYSCGGGYPIGILCIYMRSPIRSRGEREPTQLFFVIGFDFFGRRKGPGIGMMARLWEGVHNRVTSNVLCEFRDQCESDFQLVVGGETELQPLEQGG